VPCFGREPRNPRVVAGSARNRVSPRIDDRRAQLVGDEASADAVGERRAARCFATSDRARRAPHSAVVERGWRRQLAAREQRFGSSINIPIDRRGDDVVHVEEQLCAGQSIHAARAAAVPRSNG
jgi:hypothetical protein